jgi:hypothetical protein
MDPNGTLATVSENVSPSELTFTHTRFNMSRPSTESEAHELTSCVSIGEIFSSITKFVWGLSAINNKL